MSHHYVKPLLLVTLLLGGCASAPQNSDSFVPASDSQPAPATPVKDVKGKHQYVLSLMTAEDWHGAAEQLELITTGHPDLSGPWVNLGIVRTRLGDSAAAEAAFKHALDANARNVEAYNQLGMLYRRSGRLEDARFIYNEGLKQDPDHADLHWNLAILHDRYLPDPAMALAHYEHYQQLTKSDDARLQRWVVELREKMPPTEAESMTAEAKK